MSTKSDLNKLHIPNCRCNTINKFKLFNAVLSNCEHRSVNKVIKNVINNVIKTALAVKDVKIKKPFLTTLYDLSISSDESEIDGEITFHENKNASFTLESNDTYRPKLKQKTKKRKFVEEKDEQAMYLASDRLPSSPLTKKQKRKHIKTIKSTQKSQQKEEILYCYCRSPYDSELPMIACDRPGCVVEWYHFKCVGIVAAPKGKWYCPECRNK
ncbi:Zinc finger, PHD-finger,Zinc finger, PHD-type,Zinc finger, FYVE/PHD-type,Zinc finger, PHD-type [Cinara cedri]|uniref:Zinc finger, PHD-finger,Zinc finger, PHD-type,Zinc finger, FYVE/PHD-type,Zinc finger, PHD-type n=1 Tax=Cinara cedri TaxID=506608 RepID=A0A5E4N5S5_9HEMI|nr:Zinc finger, PHD-finger,Zinc finger, PHD-type,Zinc finger, FYVE/PHD-type,Zinc finger, PHD-type [Cinara cedri]